MLRKKHMTDENVCSKKCFKIFFKSFEGGLGAKLHSSSNLFCIKRIEKERLNVFWLYPHTAPTTLFSYNQEQNLSIVTLGRQFPQLTWFHLKTNIENRPE